MTTPQVLVVYPHLPHYRYGVFRQLASNERLGFYFCADHREQSGTIELIPPESLPTVRLRNLYLGPFLWQVGLFSRSARTNATAVIFLADAKYISTWASAAILRLRRIPVFFWTIGWHRPERGLKRHLRLRFYLLANMLLLYGQEAITIGGEMGYPRHRMTRVGNSGESSMARVPFSSDEDALLKESLSALSPNVAVAVVRLNAAKRLDQLIEAARLLARSGNAPTVLVVGDGPERARLERQAQDASVDVRFLGPLYSERALEEIYSVAHVTVIPSAAGLTVIQSLEHGTPVVTHDDPYAQMPEAEAVIEGVTGSLFRRDDPSDLARAMEHWFARKGQPGVREACQAEARDRWSPEVHAKAISEAVCMSIDAACGSQE